jgi:hypothetical protein
MPSKLRVKNAYEARTLLGLQLGMAGRPPFSGCETLAMQAETAAACSQLPVCLAAAAQLRNLRTLELSVWTPADDAEAPALLEHHDCTLAGLIWPIAGLQHLRQLKVKTGAVGPATAASLGVLKQLTSLKLAQHITGLDEPPTTPANLALLSGLTNLVDLEVWPFAAPQPPPPPAAAAAAAAAGGGATGTAAAAAGRFCLPRSLQRLAVDHDSWLIHLPGCPQLTELTVKHAAGGPAAVLEAAASATPKLQKLILKEWWHGSQPGAASGLPTAALAALSHLQHLNIGNSLQVSEGAHWEALGRLKALTYLSNIRVQGPPPQGWQHTGLKELGAILQLRDPQEAARLLAALPALQHAKLSVQELLPPSDASDAAAGGGGTSAAAGAASDPPATLRASPHLTSLSVLCYHGIPAMYAAPLVAAAGNSLVELAVDGDMVVRDPTAPLPDLSACTQLTKLSFGRSRQAKVGDLVGVLRPLAPTLRVLCLHGWRSMSPAAAETLQHVLPCLRQLQLLMCCDMHEEDPCGGSEEEQLQRLQQGLRPGLHVKAS